MHEDPLARFVTAQDAVYPQVIAELRAGQKRSHWMWLIFPQIHGLGSSPTAVRYAIRSREESEAYLGHPVLGPRLRECTAILLHLEGRSVEQIFGYPDDLKLHSSLSLFATVGGEKSPENDVFARALQKYFNGRLDPATLERLD